MINILELCLTEFINKRRLLELELERIVNSDKIETETKFKKTMELIEKISLTYNSIELINSYIIKNKKTD